MKRSHTGKKKKCGCHKKRRSNSWTRYIKKHKALVKGKPCEDRLKILGKRYQKRKSRKGVPLRRSKRIQGKKK